MFYCGKEEPITNNESLYQKIGGSNELMVDSASGLPINRYSFVTRGREDGAIFDFLLQELIRQLDLTAFGLFSWLVEIPTKSKIASRVIEKRHKKSGWHVHFRGNHYLATRVLDKPELQSWPPPSVDSAVGGFLVTCGPDDHEAILSRFHSDCSLFLAQSGYFAPERSFLEEVGNTGIAIIYQVNSDMENKGLVLVTSKNIDIAALSHGVKIDRVFEGESAYKAFIEI